MCGITGFIGTWSLKLAQAMTDAIAHRGPDGSGLWLDDGVALGHRRLSIIDLTEAAAQPMHSASDRYVLTYNGEIYNFAELRKDLAAVGIQYKGRSDTEVLIAAISKWGLLETLSKINGMFAFALWDRQEQRLHLVRDRFGQKPLYYG